MQSAADLDPRSLKYQYAAARTLQEAGKRPEAIPYFERIMGLNRDYELAGFWLGFAYQKTGQSQHAIDTYLRFLKHNPDHVQGHFNLAYELMNENDCQTAIVHFDRVLELRPAYIEAHKYLARCYRILGNEESATQHEKAYKSKA